MRSTFADGSWIPGYSDIDWTVVVSKEVEGSTEFKMLRKFWYKVDLLRKVFPIIGEIDIINESHLSLWTSIGITGYESKLWKLYHGQDVIQSKYLSTDNQIDVDSLRYSLKCYLTFFHKYYYNPADIYELQRSAKKVLKYAEYNSGKLCCNSTSDLLNNNKERALSVILKRLGKRISTLNNLPSEMFAVSDITSEKRFSFSEECENAIESIVYVSSQILKLTTKRACIVIIKDEIEKSINRELKEIFDVLSDYDQPLILTKSMFYYIFHVMNPMSYYIARDNYKVLYGLDPFVGNEAPLKEDVVNEIIELVPTLLTYSGRKNIFVETRITDFLDSYLSFDILKAKLILEKGEFIYRKKEVIGRYREYYPDIYKRIIAFKKEPSSLKAFLFIKRLVEDLYTFMTK